MLLLAASNTYTGPTVISGGTLALGSGGSSGATAVSVSGGATFGLAYTASVNPVNSGSSLNLASGATLNLVDGYTNTMYVSGGGTLAGATLDFGLSSGTSDVLALGGAATMTSGTNTIDLTALGSTLGLASSYTLVSASGGGLANSNFRLGSSTISVNGTPYNLHLSTNSAFSAEILSAASAVVSSGSATWGSMSGGSWSTPINWQGYDIPASGGTVAFGSAISNSATITLDTSPTLSALTFDNSAAGYTIVAGGSNTLTLSSSGSIAVVSGTHSISAPIVLPGSLAVSMTGGASLQLSGSVSDGGSGLGALVLDGEGTLILSGTGSYGGGTTVDGGMLELTSPTALADGSSLTVGQGSDPEFVSRASLGDSLLAAAGGAGGASSPAASPGVTFSPVPEPGTLALLTAALWCAAIYRRVRRKS